MGGISFEMIVVALVALGLTFIWSASLGMLYSVMRQRFHVALFIILSIAVLFAVIPYHMGYWLVGVWQDSGLWDYSKGVNFNNPVETFPAYVFWSSPVSVFLAVSEWIENGLGREMLVPCLVPLLVISLIQMAIAVRLLGGNWSLPVVLPKMLIPSGCDSREMANRVIWRNEFRTKLLDKHPILFLWQRLYTGKPRWFYCLVVGCAGVFLIGDLILSETWFTLPVYLALFAMIVMGAVCEIEYRISKDRMDGNLESILSITGPTFVIVGIWQRILSAYGIRLLVAMVAAGLVTLVVAMRKSDPEWMFALMCTFVVTGLFFLATVGNAIRAASSSTGMQSGTRTLVYLILRAGIVYPAPFFVYLELNHRYWWMRDTVPMVLLITGLGVAVTDLARWFYFNRNGRVESDLKKVGQTSLDYT